MSKTFCPLPWIHLATHPHGSVTLCCESEQRDRKSESHDFSVPRKFKTLHTTVYNFNEIQNSDSFKEVRKQMLIGQEPVECKRCFDLERVGIKSKREYDSQRIDYSLSDAISDTDADGNIDTKYQFIELRLGNHCNLGCRTCNMFSSSRWYSVWEAKNNRKVDIDKTVFDWPMDDAFWASLLEHKNSLRYIYINGGEPLLIDKHKKFLQDLVDADVAKNIEICYSTNTTVINREYDSIWKQFKKIQFMLSIDDLGPRNTYIRWPSNWNTVMTVFDWIKTLCQENHNMNYNILQTVSILNILYVKEFEDFFNQSNISINFVTDPGYYNPAILPPSIKELILEKIKGAKCEDVITKFLMLDNKNNTLTEFFEETKFMDNLRSEKFEEIFPELNQELLKYV